MENSKMLEMVATNFDHHASVRNVFGDPVHSGERTVIPVARIVMGLGGGSGGQKLSGDKNSSEENIPADVASQPTAYGDGAGGGMASVPLGVYEINPYGTKFIPANGLRNMFVAAAAGLALGALIARRRRKENKISAPSA